MLLFSNDASKVTFLSSSTPHHLIRKGIALVLSFFMIAPLHVTAQTPAEKRPTRRILFIGDSITDGNWGGGGAKPSELRNHTDWNHLFGSGYMYLCAAHYMGYYPERNYDFLNRGISGNTLVDLEKRWEKDAIAPQPDLLSILIGTNDVGSYLKHKNEYAFDFTAWEKNYRALLDRSLAANPNLRLVLCAPFVANTGNMHKSTDFALRDSLVRRCAQIVKTIAADYHAVFLPYDQLFDETFSKTPNAPDTYWLWDGVHPTPAAHRLMADMWIKQVAL